MLAGYKRGRWGRERRADRGRGGEEGQFNNRLKPYSAIQVQFLRRKTNRRRMLKLIVIFRIYFWFRFVFIFSHFFFLLLCFTPNRTDIHWHMQSEHFVVLFNTIHIQLDKDWISIFVLQT